MVVFELILECTNVMGFKQSSTTARDEISMSENISNDAKSGMTR